MNEKNQKLGDSPLPPRPYNEDSHSYNEDETSSFDDVLPTEKTEEIGGFVRNEEDNFNYQNTHKQQKPFNSYESAPKPPQKKKPSIGGKIAKACLGLIVVAAVSAGVSLAVVNMQGASWQGPDVINAQGKDLDLPEAVAAKSIPSVVAIDVYTRTQAFPGFFGQQNSQNLSELQQSSLGSGVIISDDGYILTNDHVVEGADELMVTTADGKKHKAELVGKDPSSDIAVLKIDAKNLKAIDLGKSEDLRVGQWVMTIGSPYGLEKSVATGIVSATSRSTVLQNEGGLSYYNNMIQTDAAINPGNSGGALVDQEGKLIGINTMITSKSGGYSGVGFAIPVDYAMGIAKDIMSGEKPSHAQLGVTVVTVDKASAQQFNLSSTHGAYVNSVLEGSAAEKAGIEIGDIILKCNDKEINTASDLTLAVRSVNPGDTVKIQLDRNGSEKTIDVTLASDKGGTSEINKDKKKKSELFDKE